MNPDSETSVYSFAGTPEASAPLQGPPFDGGGLHPVTIPTHASYEKEVKQAREQLGQKFVEVYYLLGEMRDRVQYLEAQIVDTADEKLRVENSNLRTRLHLCETDRSKIEYEHHLRGLRIEKLIAAIRGDDPYTFDQVRNVR